MSDSRQADVFGPSLIGAGKRPVLQPSYQAEREMGTRLRTTLSLSSFSLLVVAVDVAVKGRPSFQEMKSLTTTLHCPRTGRGGKMPGTPQECRAAVRAVWRKGLVLAHRAFLF